MSACENGEDIVGAPHRIALSRTRVAIVNDQPWVCEAMQALLERSGVLHVVESGPSHVALEMARSGSAEVLLVILDGKPDHEQALLDAVTQYPALAVVVLDPNTGQAHADKAARVAFAVVRHTQPARDIVDLLLLAGGCAYPAVVEVFEADTSGLSDLDRRLIRLSTGGVPLSRIGELLGISRAEAWDRLVAILDRLHLSDRVQLAAYAMSHGLVDVDLMV